MVRNQQPVLSVNYFENTYMIVNRILSSFEMCMIGLGKNIFEKLTFLMF